MIEVVRTSGKLDLYTYTTSKIDEERTRRVDV